MPRQLVFAGCLAAALLAGASAAVQARPVVSVELGVGVPVYGAGYYAGGHRWRHGGVWLAPWWGPQIVFTAPPVVYAAPPVALEPAPVSVPATRPDPVIYPRTGQSAAQTEADRQDCNRWAVTQPAALADAAVFQRAVEACMDGRGYTMR